MHKSSLTEHVWIRERTYLFGFPEIAVYAYLSISFWGPSPRQVPTIYADENDAKCDLIYMNMRCS